MNIYIYIYIYIYMYIFIYLFIHTYMIAMIKKSIGDILEKSIYRRLVTFFRQLLLTNAIHKVTQISRNEISDE